jgi:hypothetical protein
MKNVKNKHEINNLYAEGETTANIIGNYRLGKCKYYKRKNNWKRNIWQSKTWIPHSN